MEMLIGLCACAVNGSVPGQAAVEGIQIEELFRVADKHLLASAVGMALESAGIKAPAFVQAVAQAQRKNALLDADRARVLAELEKDGIWYVPLKGAILKDMYPRYGMRQMADNDILFDASRRADVRKIMEDLGFSVEKYDAANHDVYHKKPLSNFEMHVHLINGRTSNERLARYYDDVKDRLVKDEGNEYGYHFSDEDFYLYLVAHEYKHYVQGGTGLRSLLDTYVYLKKKEQELDWDYIRREAAKMAVTEFEAINRSLALHLFDGEALSEEEQKMLDYIISSGAYGTMANDVSNQIGEKGRLRYFISRLSLPREDMVGQYPVLKKAYWLYPVMLVWRIVKKFFVSHKKFMYQLKAAMGIVKPDREE